MEGVETADQLELLEQLQGLDREVMQMAMTVKSGEDFDAEKAFIKETITRGFVEAQEGRFAGKGLSSLDSLISELRAEA